MQKELGLLVICIDTVKDNVIHFKMAASVISTNIKVQGLLILLQ